MRKAMQPTPPLALCALLCATLFALPSCATAPGANGIRSSVADDLTGLSSRRPWRELRSANFIVLTNLSESDARSAAQDLEARYHLLVELADFLLPPGPVPTEPVLVFFLRGDRDLSEITGDDKLPRSRRHPGACRARSA